MLLGSSQSILQIQLDNDKAVEWDNIPPGSLNARSFTHDRRFVFDFYDNGSGPKSGKILLNNNITPYIMQSDSQNNKYFIVEIPITDFVFGLNTLSYELTDNNNNVTQGTLELSTDKIKKYPTDIGNYIPYSSGSLKNGKLVLQKNLRYWELNSSVLKVFYTYSGVWTEKNYTAPEDSNTYEITGIPDNSFCRIFYSAKNLFQNNTSYKYVVCFDQIAYKYTGSIGDGTHNYILKNGSAKDSFIVSGDSDVFVRVCYTKEPLSVCQNWSAENWEFMSFYVLEKKLDFRSNSNPQLFEFKTKDIPQGCCYCLVAYYANGKTGTSEVFVK